MNPSPADKIYSQTPDHYFEAYGENNPYFFSEPNTYLPGFGGFLTVNRRVATPVMKQYKQPPVTKKTKPKKRPKIKTSYPLFSKKKSI